MCASQMIWASNAPIVAPTFWFLAEEAVVDIASV